MPNNLLRGKGCYRVENTCGGTIYHGNMLEYAILATEQRFAVPYIESRRGRRPVIDGAVGQYGEDRDAFYQRIYGEVTA